ncbi:dCTP deaminase [Pseudomonas phage Noxifer]|uniref:Deoxycytidine triphosphate deaminase n=1 Tax=Pseudomonas phage Noxifer TaxID=2006684 RepID=A0A1Y0T038_9CAUD|nr:dCTP deaminase [Pseudomonas phage Noxifer]ARV77403.1 deoxycytidine triphosphate deaminase [Pseudomonas phage Noxifer]
MSIMNDRWIITQCEPPTHVVNVHTPGRPDELAWAGLTHEPEHLARLVKNFHAHLVTDEILQRDLEWRPMIEPFVRECVREVEDSKVISYGVSSFGYDVRLAAEFKIFTNANGGVIDPKRLDESAVLIDGIVRTDEWGDRYVMLPPNSYLLGRTMEYFIIPRDIMVVCLGKSTYARSGAIVNVTPIEAEFEGNVVIEISNSTTLPMKIYVGEGVSQFLFLQGNEPCMVSYKDRGGKYQGQTGITHAKV